LELGINTTFLEHRNLSRTNRGQTVGLTGKPLKRPSQPLSFIVNNHPYDISIMADAASGSADKSVQVKLVLLGALSESIFDPFGN